MASFMTNPLNPGNSVCVNVGVAASAFVERYTAPPVAAPDVATRRLFGFPGSRTMSKMFVFPVPGGSRLPSVFTVILEHATVAAAAVALVERYAPRSPSGPETLESAFPAMTATAAEVETYIVAGSVGLTRIREIARPPKQVVTIEPLVKLGLNGP